MEQHLAESFKLIPECVFEHYFFYNLPRKLKDHAPNEHESQPKAEKEHKAFQEPEYYELLNAIRGGKPLVTNRTQWTKDTTFIIFSDAGAHSGLVNKNRIVSSMAFWKHLKNFSDKVFWLNPVPIREMNDCTAKRLNLLVKMHEPDFVGLEKMFKKAASFA